MQDELFSQLASLRIHRQTSAPTRGRGGWRWVPGLGALGAVTATFYLVAVPRLEREVFETEVRCTEAISVSPAEASIQLTSAGYGVPQRVSSIAPKAAGKVQQVFVSQGQRVELGQDSSTLDPTDDNAAVAAAEVRVLAVQPQAESAQAAVLILRVEQTVDA
jgi:multidrug resistance efflux pump